MTRVKGEMLTLAREYRLMTQDSLSKKTGIAQSLIAKIEGGMKSDIDENMTTLIASSLEFPVDFFTQNEDVLGFGSSAYFYRKKSTIPATERKRIHSTVNLLRIAVKKILTFVEISPSRVLPEMDIAEYGGSASQAAKALRVFWALPDGPIKNVTALLESSGIIIVPCDFGTKTIDATSLRLTEMPPLIFINKDMPGDRWRFTLCHELAHLVLHRIPHERMEDEADEFAAEFLVPEEEIRPQLSMLNSLKLPDLVKLKEYWKVSVQMLLLRAKTLNHITESQTKYQFMLLSKQGYRLNEPAPLEKENANNLNQMISAIINDLSFTKENISKLLNWNPKEVERFFLLQSKDSPRLRIVK